MIDVGKQIRFWAEGSKEELEAAYALAEKGLLRQALFFAHLSIEKALKALVVEALHDIPPRTHDLLKLAGIARLTLDDAQEDFLSGLQRHCLAGRYPEEMPVPPSKKDVDCRVAQTKEMLEWLSKMLKQRSETTQMLHAVWESMRTVQ